MLVCELCGLYAIQPGGKLVQREVPLTSIGQIVEFLTNLGGIPGAPALRRAASVAFELSASPQESKLATRVAWDRARGGYAIPILGMNESLEVRRISRRLDEARVRRPDVILRLPGPGGPGIGLEYNSRTRCGQTSFLHTISNRMPSGRTNIRARPTWMASWTGPFGASWDSLAIAPRQEGRPSSWPAGRRFSPSSTPSTG